MRKRIRALHIVAFLLGATVLAASWAGASELRTENFRLVWDEEKVPSSLVETAQEKVESRLAAVVRLLGESFAPRTQITVILHGPADSGTGDYPRVDSWGRVHLYQYGPDPSSHLSPLAHELVHVLRNPQLMQRDHFFEEGYASFVGLRVEPSLPGFPFYGSAVHVVAGQWLSGEEELALGDLAEDHRDLNLRCRLQSYSLRASFFDYLGRRYGERAVHDLAATVAEVDSVDWRSAFGSAFDDLEAAWRDDLWRRFVEDPQGIDEAAAYRDNGAVPWIPTCWIIEGEIELRRDQPSPRARLVRLEAEAEWAIERADRARLRRAAEGLQALELSEPLAERRRAAHECALRHLERWNATDRAEDR